MATTTIVMTSDVWLLLQLLRYQSFGYYYNYPIINFLFSVQMDFYILFLKVECGTTVIDRGKFQDIKFVKNSISGINIVLIFIWISFVFKIQIRA